MYCNFKRTHVSLAATKSWEVLIASYAKRYLTMHSCTCYYFLQFQRYFYQVLGSWYTTLLQNPSGSQKWGMCVNFQLIFLSYKLGFNRTVSYKLVFRVSKIICLTTLLTTFRIFLQVIYLIKIFFSKKASVQQELFFL